MAKRKAVILGAGITGLRCAQQLSPEYDVTVLEKHSAIGGMAASFRYGDFTLDLGPHKLYSQLPGIMDAYKEILRGKVHTVEKKNTLRLSGTDFSFPPKIPQLVLRFPKLTLIRLGLSFMAAKAKGLFSKKLPVSYEEYFMRGFGSVGYNYLFKHLCMKIWGDPKEISAELASRRVPIPSIPHLVLSVLQKKKQEKVSAKYFYYPAEGGSGTLCDNLADEVQKSGGKIEVNTTPERITRNGKQYALTSKAKGGKTKTIAADVIVSTIYLKDFLGLFEKVPKEVSEAAGMLRYRPLLLNYLILNTPDILGEEQWRFYPQGDALFSRISELKKFGPQTCPKDKTVLTVEVGCEPGDEVSKLSKEQLRERILADLDAVGVPVREKLADFFVVRSAQAYPLYDLTYKKNLLRVLDWIDTVPDIYALGRQGLFNYSNMDHSIDMADKTAKHIIAGSPIEEWKKLREYFDSYRIVD